MNHISEKIFVQRFIPRFRDEKGDWVFDVRKSVLVTKEEAELIRSAYNSSPRQTMPIPIRELGEGRHQFLNPEHFGALEPIAPRKPRPPALPDYRKSTAPERWQQEPPTLEQKKKIRDWVWLNEEVPKGEMNLQDFFIIAKVRCIWNENGERLKSALGND